MKILLSAFVTFFLIQCSGQPKKTLHINGKLRVIDKSMQSHDSSYGYWTYDTLRGSVSYSLGGGTVKGEGAIITERYWQCHRTVYDYLKAHDSLMAVNNKRDSISGGYGTYLFGGSCMSIDGGLNYHKNCYIKTKQGWRRIDEEYTFIPD